MGLKEEIQDLDRKAASIVGRGMDARDLFIDSVHDKYGDTVTILDMDGDFKGQRRFLLKQMTKPDNGQVTFDYYYQGVNDLLFIRKEKGSCVS